MLNNIKFLLISLFISLIVFFNQWQIKNDYILWKDDWLRHAKFAEYVNTLWLKDVDNNHNWWNILTWSILEKYNVDLWQWHHLLLSTFFKFWAKLDDISKIYISLFIFLFCFIVLFFNSQLKNNILIWLSTIFIFLFLNNEFISRIYLWRPFLITTFLFFVLLLILYNKKYKVLFIIFLIASFYHFLFFLLFLPILLYIIIIKDNYKEILTYSLFWSLFWILIHTKSLIYLWLWFFSVFWVTLFQMFSWTTVWELWVSNNLLFRLILISIIILVNIYLYWDSKEIKKEILSDKFYIFINILTFILFIFWILISRFWDFFIISYIFLFLIICSKIIIKEKISLNYKYNIIIFILLLILISLSNYIYIKSINTDDSNYIWEKKEFILNSKNFMKSGSVITSTNSYDLYMFYYLLWNDYKYLMTMERVYMELYNKKLFSDLKDVTDDIFSKPKNINVDIYKTIKSYWVKYYIILEEKNNYMLNRSILFKINEINKNSNFKLLYKYKNNYLWEIK